MQRNDTSMIHYGYNCNYIHVGSAIRLLYKELVHLNSSVVDAWVGATEIRQKDFCGYIKNCPSTETQSEHFSSDNKNEKQKCTYTHKDLRVSEDELLTYLWVNILERCCQSFFKVKGLHWIQIQTEKINLLQSALEWQNHWIWQNIEVCRSNFHQALNTFYMQASKITHLRVFWK